MKAVILEGPEKCRLVETERPEPDGLHAVVQVTACGICGSDLHFWKHGSGMGQIADLVMGHEFCGRVHDAGCREDLSVGDRVAVIPINPCGNCDFCENGWHNLCREGNKRPLPGLTSPGGYAHYCRVNADLVRKIPENVSDREAAMIEPAAVALHAVHQAGVQPGDTVLVSGGGPIGHLAALWARLLGASRVDMSEVNPFRMRFAGKNGSITTVYDARDPNLGKNLKKQTGGVDKVIETSASDEGIHLGVTVLKSRGHLVLTGINYSAQRLSTLLCTMKELTLKTSFGYTLGEFEMVLGYLARKNLHVDFLITQAIPLDKVQETFENLSSGAVNGMKTLICPWDEG
jgi:2-desacetyl-2-hydroxyethyl bacteriochlorophyllide A dehydrogenase